MVRHDPALRGQHGVCNDKVSGAYFSKLLGDFTRNYYELLGDLAALPGSPAVLVNQYYSPFGPGPGLPGAVRHDPGQGEGPGRPGSTS